ncbi:hypothetical protein DJ82_12470 [Halorubrum sp. Ib24]|uniref:hypothetical protein n=1 Tax=Halorubrum sp. Ib24 TaxID=1383850 RepID=UPI000B982A39|nr:hypothetical protein [Halorubrum sp. Ib24]OYR38386.1 hypothetical protein DJ82_12470 [Halorubrum sp. Ib24]
MKAALLLIVGFLGLVQTLAPRPVVRAWTKAVYRDAGDAEPREWAYVAARAEGAVLALVSMAGLYRLATAEADDSGPIQAPDEPTDE